jgi:ATP-dependent 26S proteasome regulatory subunit
MSIKLCPAQQRAFEALLSFSPLGQTLTLFGGTGAGKTTVLCEAHRELGGAFLGMKDFTEAMHGRHPLALEETFEELVMAALAAHDAVIIDDLHLLNRVVCCHFYPRIGFLDASLTSLSTYAVSAKKKLVFGSEHSAPAPIHQRTYYAGIEDFKPADYQHLCHQYLDAPVAGRLDYQKIHRFATKLNAHQLKSACLWLKRDEALDTESFIEYLRSQRLASNVDLSEVEEVDLHDLRGVDDVIKSLEANIILPLENDELATELNLKPKRGVLLAGPPGTGKTTIGRALAHRLKSKFFLVDGTLISGTAQFYGRIHQIFEAAKQNAPSIIFIDDSDAIFESGEELGLYRYLLTVLDGLESESTGRVCVMLTAMDVGNLPPALIRSGRIELWLEMRLPDDDARASILSSNLTKLPVALADADCARLVASTAGLTGADLRRLLEDGKALYAYDRAQKLELRPATEYFLAAVETVRANKERYAAAEARARQQRPARPHWFEMFNEVSTFSEDYSSG